jgi:gas vesicle protein
MKPLHVIMAVVGGALVGAAVGMLYAPKKGRYARRDIYRFLRRHGVDLRRSQIEKLVKEMPVA